MGYQTVYTLEIVTDIDEVLEIDRGITLEDVGVFAETNGLECVEAMLSGDNCMKWYDHDDDMKKVSNHFHGVLFCLHGKGEEDDDYWKTYYYNGKLQTCKAEVKVVYPDFDPTKMR